MRTVYFRVFGKKMKMNIDINTDDEERIKARLINIIRENVSVDKVTGGVDKKVNNSQVDLAILEELKGFFGMK